MSFDHAPAAATLLTPDELSRRLFVRRLVASGRISDYPGPAPWWRDDLHDAVVAHVRASRICPEYRWPAAETETFA